MRTCWRATRRCSSTRYPNAKLVAPGYTDTHALYHLEDSMKVRAGDEIDLGGGFVVRFQEATFLDAAMSVWMTELTSNTLFSVDWMGLPLLDGEELLFMDEVENVDVDRFYEFHARVMFWFQYVDVDKVVADTNLMLQQHHPAMVASSHGPVIRSDVWRYFQMMNEVVAKVRETGRIGVL
jgi:flavorubredoxin